VTPRRTNRAARRSRRRSRPVRASRRAAPEASPISRRADGRRSTPAGAPRHRWAHESGECRLSPSPTGARHLSQVASRERHCTPSTSAPPRRCAAPPHTASACRRGSGRRGTGTFWRARGSVRQGTGPAAGGCRHPRGLTRNARPRRGRILARGRGERRAGVRGRDRGAAMTAVRLGDGEPRPPHADAEPAATAPAIRLASSRRRRGARQFAGDAAPRPASRSASLDAHRTPVRRAVSTGLWYTCRLRARGGGARCLPQARPGRGDPADPPVSGDVKHRSRRAAAAARGAARRRAAGDRGGARPGRGNQSSARPSTSSSQASSKARCCQEL
jgi:hypothetical protein